VRKQGGKQQGSLDHRIANGIEGGTFQLLQKQAATAQQIKLISLRV